MKLEPDEKYKRLWTALIDIALMQVHSVKDAERMREIAVDALKWSEVSKPDPRPVVVDQKTKAPLLYEDEIPLISSMGEDFMKQFDARIEEAIRAQKTGPSED